MENIWKDLANGLRSLTRRPSFTIAAVLTLAGGIGANTVIFSVVNAVLLRPLPFQDSERLVAIWESNKQQAEGHSVVSVPNFRDWMEQSKTFEGIAAFNVALPTLVDDRGAERVAGAIASGNFFSVLHLRPALGRLFVEEDGRPDGPRVAVLSNALWQRRFGGDAAVIGKTIILDGDTSYTIVGVLPATFQLPESDFFFKPVDLWQPLQMNAAEEHRDSRFLHVLGRLSPSVSLEQARAEMSAIAGGLGRSHPDTNAGWGINLVQLEAQIVGQFRPVFFLLIGVVGFVLLIACVNVANLLLTRAVGRQRELAIRAALGASQFRLIRALLSESLLLSAVGGALGLFMSSWGLALLVAVAPATIPRLNEARLDGRVLGFTIALSIATAILSGLAPALAASRVELSSALRYGSPGSGGGSHRLYSALVVSEVALAVVALIGAGLMIASLERVTGVDSGFKAANLLTMEVTLSGPLYKERSRLQGFYEQAIRSVERLPGVRSACVISDLPLSQWRTTNNLTIEGRVPIDPSDRPDADYRIVSPGYFETMEIPVQRGRGFTEHDTGDSIGVVAVNQTFAGRLFTGQDPIGKRISFRGAQGPWLTIVGVVGDIHHKGPESVPFPEVYRPLSQSIRPLMHLVARTSGEPAALIPAVRRELTELDRTQAAYDVQTMEQRLAGLTATRRFSTSLTGMFAGAALFLAGLGLYGVISYAVSSGTREIGIRIALGADRRTIVRSVMGRGLVLALLGAGIGLSLAFGVTRLLATLLFGVSATEPAIFIGVPVLLTLVAAAACYMPARRAARVDPIIALRYE